MNFDESVEYLLSLGNEVLAMKLGLENIGKLLDALGKPHEKYFKVQVAGTNGKGSTCAFLEGISLAAGIKTGLFTSPHLISITERVRINGSDISEENFARIATVVRERSERLVVLGELETAPTFFEQVTAIGLYAFVEAGVELAILETGLGGRFDAITAARAEVAVITPIDYDHQDILGHTLAEIAAEKAAIIRKDSRVIVGEQKPEAMDVIARHCREVGCIPIISFCSSIIEGSDETSFRTAVTLYPNVRLSLAGEHQIQNACLAIRAAEVLGERFTISAEDVMAGLESARHRGRLEWLNDGRNGAFLFDGAHNVAGAHALRNYLEKYRPGSKITLVFAAMRDKDISDIAEVLFPLAQDLIVTRADNPRSLDPALIVEAATEFLEPSHIFVVPDLSAALDSATQINDTYPATGRRFICVTGSLYLVGEAMKLVNNR